MALHCVHKSVWSHCEICKELVLPFDPFSSGKQSSLPSSPSSASRERITDPPIAHIDKRWDQICQGADPQCGWLHTACWVRMDRYSRPLFYLHYPFHCLSLSLSKCSLGVKNKYIFLSFSSWANESELPRTVIIKVLESINRKYFFFLRLSARLPSLQPWGQKHHQWQEVLLGSKILLRPQLRRHSVGNVIILR